MFAFVAAAFLITYASGTIMLFLLEELGATSPSHLTASAGIDLALGALLIALAVRLFLKRPGPAPAARRRSPADPRRSIAI